ncbi:MAG: hypothetical protein ACI8UO_005902 [Verrucomicrobiales bacterium]|jgi:hypothetical protein
MNRPNTLVVIAAFSALAFASAPMALAAEDEEHDHAHDEVALGTFDIKGIKVEAAQGHGKVEAGKEGHLVIKLPYSDKGDTVVRAWIGTDDRTLSTVGKGDYASAHDDYDIHAVAPDPLPEGAKWWVQIQKPNGAKSVGSIPLRKDVIGPHEGMLADFKGGRLELKLHDDKGDLELWLTSADGKKPFDLAADAKITVAFEDAKEASVTLVVRNTAKNEDEDGEPNMRDGQTNYFIFPGETGADAAWLMGPKFKAQVTVSFGDVRTEKFLLIPHTHHDH